MGLFSHVSSLRVQANTDPDASWKGMHGAYVPGEWVGSLSAAGIQVTPDLALTLGAVYSAVKTIARDMGTLPAKTYRVRSDGGKDRVPTRAARSAEDVGGISRLAYLLRWQPNTFQTAPEYQMSMLAQFLLRGRCYAEIVSSDQGAITALLPRHPDRVMPKRLPDGGVQYEVREADGQTRTIAQDDMHTVSDISFDGGMTVASVSRYGAQAIGTALASQRAAGKFFKSGMTASALVTYKGEQKGDEDEAALHKSISRYAAGAENSFGLMLVPDSIDVKTLAIDPAAAQMMEAQEWGVREVARLFNLPGHKLGIKDSVSFNSQVQGALEYVISCLRPITVLFEASIQRDLIIAQDTYLVEYELAGLLRGDFSQQATYIEKLIRNRVMWPSEARAILNMNPDEELDELSKRDRQPGQAGSRRRDNRDGERDERNARDQRRGAISAFSRGGLRAVLAVHDNAVRCQKRERAAVERLAKKHASDPDGWVAGLQDFMADHARFVAQTMRIPIEQAREHVAAHGLALKDQGVGLHTDDWEREQADDLAALAVGDAEVAA